MNENNIPEENDVLQENAVLPEPVGENAEEPAFDAAAFEEAYAEKEQESVFDQSAFEEAYAEKEQAEEALNEQLTAQTPVDSAGTVSHELLQHPEVREELNAAEHAMYDAGLVHPDDVDFIEPRQSEMPQEPAPAHHDAEYRDPEYQQIPEEMQIPEETYEDSESDAEPELPVRKGRPRRKKGYGFLGIPHLIATVIWLAIIVAIGVSMGRLIWVCAADVLAFGREEQLVTVTITSEDDIDTIAAKLNQAGLIRYPSLFKLYADLAVDEGEISTGTFTLNTLYDYHALVNSMSASSSTRKVIEGVLIPEGFTCKQIFARLEEYGVCSASELEAYAAEGELDEYWFLENLERGDKYCLEGYLFPATYDFYENSSPKQALEKMLDAFDAYYSAEMQEQLAATNERLSAMMLANGCTQEYVDAHQLTVRDIVTVASLIEKEMAGEEEARTIASVIYNRLTQDEEHERYLNIDAAIFYALGEHKEALTSEDLQVDSPYNTYLYSGLVPGPIANPGLACLKAALDFEDTSYYYYVLNPEVGEHDFSKTYEEHDKKVQKYYGQDGEG
ncbi:MAG: endolytic transglycosylase MltG [Oscillospiraceae bacterium]|nr:endolytic transglycosylase MltG [Oscillospiraceae bacterium]